MLAEEQIVGVRPVDAANLIDVAKALGDQERSSGPFALQNCVDSDGRAVKKKPGGSVIAMRLLDRGIDALDQVLRG